MKKLLLIALFILLVFSVSEYPLNNNENSVINQESKLFIGGRLPLNENNNTIKNDIIGIINMEEYKINDVEKNDNDKIITADDLDNTKKEIKKNEENISKNSIRASTENTEITDDQDRDMQTSRVNQRLNLIDKIKEHEVQRGESLWTIAQNYNIDIDTLIGANDIANMNMIQAGDTLKILPIKGILYRINPGENLWEISRDFEIPMDKITEANNIINPSSVQPGECILLPGAKPKFGYRERMSSKLMPPVQARISSYYGMRWGRMHEGIDFAVNTGTKIKASAAGKVVYCGWANGYGYTVILEHQRGVRTLYAHNSKLLVHSGQYVNKGQAISLSGNTGNSTGPHLHFEVQINGRPVNPLSYIR